MSPKILKKQIESFESRPFQFQATRAAEIGLEAEAELDAFSEAPIKSRFQTSHHSQPQVDVADLIERAQADAEAILSDARQRASALERDAYEKGLAEGRKTGEIMAEQQLQAILTQYHHSLTVLDEMRDLMINQNQLEIMELVIHTSQRVINAELTLNPAAILPMIKHALQNLKQRKGMVIYLNGEDHQFILTMAELERQKWLGTQCQIDVDPTLSRGSFRVETIAGELDASIEAQLHSIQDNLANAIGG